MERIAEIPREHEHSAAATSHGRDAAPLSPVLQLQEQAGNQAVQQLLRSGIQAKLAISSPDDPEEREADHVAHTIMRSHAGAPSSAPCSCSHDREMCEECQLISATNIQVHRKTNGLYVQRFSAEENAPRPVGTTGAGTSGAGGGISGASMAPAGVVSPGLIVEDRATDLGTGQMKKSEFLGQLRGPVTGAAQTGLQGTMWATLGSVAIGPWFQYYAGQSAQQLERTIQRSVPGSAGVTNVSAYVSMVSARVQIVVGEWARTGKVPPDAPTGLPGMDLPGGGLLATVGGVVSDLAQGAKDIGSSIGSGISSLAQGASNLVSNIADVLFKPKGGGARITDDPEAIQGQLGSGEALEGSLQGRMSSAFGYDFSGVRVHKDNRAAQLSADLNARAFTIGHNVAFGAGEYQPGSPIGDALIAHELAHVVQQGGASSHAPLQKGEAETDSLEEDADVSAVQAVVSLWGAAKAELANVRYNTIPALRSGLRLQRCEWSKKRNQAYDAERAIEARKFFKRYKIKFNGKRIDPDKLSDDEVRKEYDDLSLHCFAIGHRRLDPDCVLAMLPPPIMTQWGWSGSQEYRKALKQLNEINTPEGTADHQELNGRVPTREEALRMIEEAGGEVVRGEETGHGPGSVSGHDYPHVNYYTASGAKGTIRVK